MIQIGNVPEIVEVKQTLARLQQQGLLRKWELPYENVLTRLDAAIFFLTPEREDHLQEIWRTFDGTPRLKYEKNATKELSDLEWRVEFNAEK